MHEFNADRAAVCVAQHRQNLPQGGAFLHKAAGVEGPVEISLVEAEGGQREERMVGFAGGERVSAGEQVADITIAVNQGLDAGLLQRQLRRRILCAGDCGRHQAQLKAAKEGAPLRGKLGRLLLPQLELGFQPGRADVVEKPHGWILGQQGGIWVV